MIDTEPFIMPAADEYYSMYLDSQKRLRTEEVISESLLESLMMLLKRNFVIMGLAALLNLKEDKIDKGLISETINELFFEKGFRCSGMTRHGYETYGYSVYGTFVKKKVEVFIPNPKKLDIQNIKYAHYGRYSFGYEEKEGYWKIICSSYDISEIRRATAEFRESQD